MTKEFTVKDWHDEIEATDTPVSAAALEDAEKRVTSYAAEILTTNTILHGSGAPSEGTGNNGDFYLDTTAHKIYGPKAAGVWPAGVELVGPKGETGTTGTAGKTVLNGSGAPSAGTGADGDFYLDTSTYKIYGPKASGSWPAGVELKGAAGRNAGLKYTYSSTTTEFGAEEKGKLRFNNATLSSATILYIQETDADEASAAAWIQTWDDSTNTVKGHLTITKDAAPQNYRIYKVTGSITDKGAWDNVTISHVSGNGTFENGDTVRISFSRAGDKGEAVSGVTTERSLLSTAFGGYKVGGDGEDAKAYVVLERWGGVLNRVHLEGQVSYNAVWTVPAEYRPKSLERNYIKWSQYASAAKDSLSSAMPSAWVFLITSTGEMTISKPSGSTLTSGSIDLTGIYWHVL